MDNVPTRIRVENPGNPGVRARAGGCPPFFGVPDIPELLIAGNEGELLSYFYHAWGLYPGRA